LHCTSTTSPDVPEVVENGGLALLSLFGLGAILPERKFRSRPAQGLSRLPRLRGPPEGLGLDRPEHSGILDRIGAGGARHIIGKFKPVALGEIHAAGDRGLTAATREVKLRTSNGDLTTRDAKILSEISK
jgi:hypothetical protein